MNVGICGECVQDLKGLLPKGLASEKEVQAELRLYEQLIQAESVRIEVEEQSNAYLLVKECLPTIMSAAVWWECRLMSGIHCTWMLQRQETPFPAPSRGPHTASRQPVIIEGWNILHLDASRQPDTGTEGMKTSSRWGRGSYPLAGGSMNSNQPVLQENLQ